MMTRRDLAQHYRAIGRTAREVGLTSDQAYAAFRSATFLSVGADDGPDAWEWFACIWGTWRRKPGQPWQRWQPATPVSDGVH